MAAHSAKARDSEIIDEHYTTALWLMNR